MTFHYAGKYNGDPDSLPQREHPQGAVKFKEAKDAKTLGRIANLIALRLMALLSLAYFVRGRQPWSILGFVLFLVTMIPHEFLHALCFREDVYMYQDLRHGMLFVVGTESMSKGRFIFMSLLPNIVFGLIPFVLFLIWPELTWLGTLGIAALASGAGDYINVFNALTQMPAGSYTYLHGFGSYWYMPESE